MSTKNNSRRDCASQTSLSKLEVDTIYPINHISVIINPHKYQNLMYKDEKIISKPTKDI